MSRSTRLLSSAAIAWAVSVSPAAASLITFSGTGADAPAIQAVVDNFRTAAGNPNNGNSPGLLSGRREINWDGGGAATTVTAGNLTAFLDNRGGLFSTPGTGFVQAPISGMVTQFGQPGYATEFDVFSLQRLFTPMGSNITDVTFFVPGTAGAVAATVAGFGAVFTDVDLANTTSLQFFGLNNLLLGSIFVQQFGPSGGLSFAGGVFDAGERIARVRITTGNAAPGAPDAIGAADVVLMDDFIYSEPQAIVPEPPTVLLLGLGLIGVCAYRRLT
jgi:hypothetical protein